MPHVSIAVDSEFQSLIPPLSDDEYQRLEKSILVEGVREPIITWNGTIVDGHNRYRICDEHGLECPQAERQFASRDAAKIWIIENQFGRRNLSSGQKAALAIEQNEAKVREAARLRMLGGKKIGVHTLGSKEPRVLDDTDQTSSAQKQTGRTAGILGKKAGVGSATIKRALKVKNDDPELYDKVRSGEVPVTAAYEQVMSKGGRKNASYAPDGRRVCSICGEPIDEGESYKDHPAQHSRCFNRQRVMHRDYADHDLMSNTATYTMGSLLTELHASADSLREAWEESVAINESMGVRLTGTQRKRLDRAVANLFKTIQKIGEEANNG